MDQENRIPGRGSVRGAEGSEGVSDPFGPVGGQQSPGPEVIDQVRGILALESIDEDDEEILPVDEVILVGEASNGVVFRVRIDEFGEVASHLVEGLEDLCMEFEEILAMKGGTKHLIPLGSL